MPTTRSPKTSKYALVERERRFLLAALPEHAERGTAREIHDRYLTGTTLRLRRVIHPDGAQEFKFTQKVRADRPGPVQGWITNTYLDETEYTVLAGLPAAVLRKTRYSVPPFGIDVFEPPLHGLVLAEVEFTRDEDVVAFRPPAFVVAEVTADPRFTGGSFVVAGRAELLSWLADYGISPESR